MTNTRLRGWLVGGLGAGNAKHEKVVSLDNSIGLKGFIQVTYAFLSLSLSIYLSISLYLSLSLSLSLSLLLERERSKTLVRADLVDFSSFA